MADTFVKMIEFQATGLSQIATGLKSVQQTQKLITQNQSIYNNALRETKRSLSDMERFIKSPAYGKYVRDTDTLAKSQERLTRTMERQKAVARYGALAGNAAHFGGRAALSGLASAGAGVAAAGFGAGVAGLSGTVPMARLNNQMERFTWELGNTLTPFVDMLTRKLGAANNWLAKQPESTQDNIGTGLVAGAALVGGNFLSKHILGASLGRVGLGITGAGMEGAGVAFGAARSAGLAGAASANMAYGMGGVRGLAGLAGEGLAAASRFAGPLAVAGAGISGGVTNLRVQSLNQQADEAARGKTDPTHFDEYSQKFSGLEGDSLKKAIEVERQKLLRQDIAGTKDNDIGFFGALYRSAMPGATAVPGKAAMNENEMRRNALAEIAGERPASKRDHRSNAIVGGDWGELGSNYYAAASELAKSGYDKADAGGGGGKNPDALLDALKEFRDMVKEAADKQANPLK